MGDSYCEGMWVFDRQKNEVCLTILELYVDCPRAAVEWNAGLNPGGPVPGLEGVERGRHGTAWRSPKPDDAESWSGQGARKEAHSRRCSNPEVSPMKVRSCGRGGPGRGDRYHMGDRAVPYRVRTSGEGNGVGGGDTGT